MRVFTKINPLVRSLMVVGGVAVLVGGVTFAALNDSATLTGNTISSDTADLQVSNGGAYGDDVNGFVVENVVPGTGKTYSFYLKNGSDFPMKVSAKLAAAPVVTATNISNLDKVIVKIAGDDGVCTAVVNTNLNALNTGSVALPCDPLPANEQGVGGVQHVGNYKITFDLDPAALTGGVASVSAFNLVFTGEQVVLVP